MQQSEGFAMASAGWRMVPRQAKLECSDVEPPMQSQRAVLFEMQSFRKSGRGPAAVECYAGLMEAPLFSKQSERGFE